MKRVVLFILTNLAVLLVLGTVLSLLGVNSLLDEQGVNLNLSSLLVFSAVFGMGGSFISLLVSKFIAKRMCGAQVITQASNPTEEWLLQTVSHHAQAAGIGMPEVAVFPSDSPNAFATGASRNKALVAVSTGLLRSMKRDEVEAVIGHEISHVANGDMITLALVQGVVNTFVIFLSRLVGYFVDRVVLKNERGLGIGFYVTSIVAQMVFGVLASTIVFWFSRQREFRADEGGARLVGTNSMIGALERLKGGTEPLPDAMAAFGIAGGKSFSRLFMSHPPLDERIAALRAKAG